VIGTLDRSSYECIDLLIGGDALPRGNFGSAKIIHRLLRYDLSSQAHAGTKTFTVDFVLQIIELDLRFIQRTCRSCSDSATAQGFVVTDMNLETMPAE